MLKAGSFKGNTGIGGDNSEFDFFAQASDESLEALCVIYRDVFDELALPVQVLLAMQQILERPLAPVHNKS